MPQGGPGTRLQEVWKRLLEPFPQLAHVFDHHLVVARDPALPEGLPGLERIRAQRIAVLVDIDADLDYSVHSDLHLHVVAQHAVLFVFPVCTVNPRFANREVTSYCLARTGAGADPVAA